MLRKKGERIMTKSNKEKQPNQPMKGSKKVKNQNHSRQKKHASHDL
ncbi:small acid-soluble spore protein P [Thalassobacillus hwangdonensis]|uniref:Small acid-soluble spore protein P n=1 Tax=Thalassobacillus hwangdonensis TaxID=546108 RepID=A0ABW3KXM2_9BACI